MRLTPNTPNVRSYRKRHKRIDYYPNADIAEIIAHHLAKGHEPCLSGVLDGLIRAGHRLITGKHKP